jgi:hypothetical protein
MLNFLYNSKRQKYSNESVYLMSLTEILTDKSLRKYLNKYDKRSMSIKMHI